MTKPASSTVERLLSRFDSQAREMTAIRATLDNQFKRIALMQAELDVLPLARRRRKTTRSMLAG